MTAVDSGRRLSALGRYELLARLDHSGGADVHLGRLRGAAGFEKLVVVRILDGTATDLLEEARRASLIKHPNVIDIDEVGEEQGTYFIVTEALEGETLRTIVDSARARRRIDVPDAARVIALCAEGLQAAHELPEPLAHGHLTMSSIVVQYNGRVKLADFGVRTERVLETTAPEKLRGAAGDPKSDVFSLGIILWEALTHERLIEGETDDAIRRAIRDLTIPKPSEVSANVPGAFDDIVMRALQPDPADRYATIEELANDIEDVLRDAGYSRKNDRIAAYMTDVFADRIAARKKVMQQLAAGKPPGASVIAAAYAPPSDAPVTVALPPIAPLPPDLRPVPAAAAEKPRTPPSSTTPIAAVPAPVPARRPSAAPIAAGTTPPPVAAVPASVPPPPATPPAAAVPPPKSVPPRVTPAAAAAPAQPAALAPTEPVAAKPSLAANLTLPLGSNALSAEDLPPEVRARAPNVVENDTEPLAVVRDPVPAPPVAPAPPVLPPSAPTLLAAKPTEPLPAPKPPEPRPPEPKPPVLPDTHPAVAAVSLPVPAKRAEKPERAESEADVLSRWAWKTDSQAAITDDDDDYQGERRKSRRTLLYVIGGGVAVAAIVTIIAFAFQTEKPARKPEASPAAFALVDAAPVALAVPDAAPVALTVPDAAPVAVATADAASLAAVTPPVAADAAAVAPPPPPPPEPEPEPAVVKKDDPPKKADPPPKKDTKRTAKKDDPPPKKTSAKKTSRGKRSDPKLIDPYAESAAAPEPTPTWADPAEAYRTGLQQYARGETTAALYSLRSAVSGNPRHAPSWRAIGMVYEKMGKRAQARAAFEKYLRLAPDASDAAQIRERLARL